MRCVNWSRQKCWMRKKPALSGRAQKKTLTIIHEREKGGENHGGNKRKRDSDLGADSNHIHSKRCKNDNGRVSIVLGNLITTVSSPRFVLMIIFTGLEG